MEFYLPASTGEWLAWSSAAVTSLFGVIMFFAPGITMKVLRLQPAHGSLEAYASIRAMLAGFYLGVGLGCLIFAQPFLWLVLGACWGFVLFGRIISVLSVKRASFYSIIAALLEFVLAAGPLLYAFGFIV